MRSRTIGVFDSGFGGLSILKHIVRELPEYRYVYLGDTARTPYGNRSKDTVLKFTKQAVDFLFRSGCELIVIACNTASAEALPEIQRTYLKKFGTRKRVLGVIVPTLEYVTTIKDAKKIGLLATESTVMSGTFERELRKINRQVRIVSQPAPLLVPLVESGETDRLIRHSIIERYVKPLRDSGVDTVILGCTHYEHLEKEISTSLGKRVRVVAEGPIVAHKLKEYLIRHPEIETTLKKLRGVTFYSTESSSRFKKLGKIFYGREIKPKIAHIETI